MSAGIAWEREVANYLDKRGFRTWVRRTVSGHEIDVYGEKDQFAIAVECKDWEDPVTPDAVRQINSVAEDIDTTAVLAYTSALTPGAQELAERWAIVILSPEVVKGTAPSIENLKTLSESHDIALPDVADTSRLWDPLGPFQITSNFASTIATSVEKNSFETIEDLSWLERRLQGMIESREADLCVPIIRHDVGTLELYFITETPSDVLPEIIDQESINLR